jgi:F-type H+-transporting ATPase subunit gamma
MALPAPKNHLGAIVFGSDQGMCGQFNDQIISHAINTMNDIGIKLESRMILAVGMRVATRLEDAGLPVEESLPLPISTFGITPIVQDILMKIENWHLERGIDQIILFYNRHFESHYYHPHTVHLLPVDLEQFQHLENKEWPSHVLPIFTMDGDQLFSSLIRQYLFISLYRAFAESLASENVSRLASMQGAEKNISERLNEFNAQLRQQRQMSITEELLDIVAGFETLKN